MRILLINPRFPLSLWDFSLCRDLDGHAYPHAPLSLPTLAALTPREHSVRLYDENVENVENVENGANAPNGASGAKGAKGANGAKGASGARGATGAKGANAPNGASGAKGAKGAKGANGAKGAAGADPGPLALAADADLVGITGYWIQRQRVFELADALRARGCVVALGGPLVEASTLAECEAHADAVFVGEAEYTWPRYLADLAAGHPAARYVQADLVDMADSPLPRFELLAPGAYSAATVETSRGCPYRCEFCEIPARLGPRSRAKSVAQVLAEVRAHHALGARTVFFVDDHMLGDRRRARELLTALAEFVESIDHRMFFSCQFTINLAKDDEILALLWRANFRRVFVGIETPQRPALESARKRQNLGLDLVAAVRKLHAHNIVVWAGLIVGFDSDDAGAFEAQRRFLQEAGVPVAMIGLLQAIPGTPLHARMQREGRLRDSDMAGVRGPYEGLIRSNIVPLALTDRELVAGYQRLVAAVYQPEAYGERVLAAVLGGRRPLHRTGGGVRAKDLAIVARLARYYLAGGRQRRRLFLRVVTEVLRRRPRALESALMHLVVYKHLHAFYAQVAALPPPDPGAPSGALDAR